MACYEWKCQKCGHKFEKMGAPNPLCPECLGTTEKQISSGAFHLKGGGWAAEGYSKENKDGQST